MREKQYLSTFICASPCSSAFSHTVTILCLSGYCILRFWCKTSKRKEADRRIVFCFIPPSAASVPSLQIISDQWLDILNSVGWAAERRNSRKLGRNLPSFGKFCPSKQSRNPIPLCYSTCLIWQDFSSFLLLPVKLIHFYSSLLEQMGSWGAGLWETKINGKI